MKKKIVYFVHCVDTEGPLYESLTAKFQRVKDIFNINIKVSKENLEKLKLAKIPLQGKEKKIASVLSSHLTNYNSNWKKINNMILRIFSSKFRNSHKDSFGKPWVFNWHCLDHVGYKTNPRKRTLGYHKISDYYSKVLKKYKYKYEDQIHWHFHPMSTYNEAHRCATSYANSPELYQILCRKIIDRNYFPSVFRAGFQAERPDSNLFLEQWIPFDITNMSSSNNKDLDMSLDFKLGRSGDWRRAPKNWNIYHPSHDDYQKPGNCRRWIGRALNVMNRIGSIDQKEMNRHYIATVSDFIKPNYLNVSDTYCDPLFFDPKGHMKHMEDMKINDEMKKNIKNEIKKNCSPKHLPKKIVQIEDIPYTLSGKKVELAVKKIINGNKVDNKDALINPESLQFFENLSEIAN